MAKKVDLKNVVKHLVNGSFGDNLCLLCLAPLLEDGSENVFSVICIGDNEFCIADALEIVCQLKLDHTENFRICLECLQSTTSSYSFNLQAKQSIEILSFYTKELNNFINKVEQTEISNDNGETLLCIPLPLYQPKSKISKDLNSSKEDNIKETKKDDVIIIVDKENKSCYQVKDKLLKAISDDDDDDEMVMIVNEKKERKKREPMTYMSCSKCPVKYRFVSKLKVHMKNDHNIDIFYCKICKIISENKQVYEAHLKSHSGDHQCTICNMVYKKRETLLAHMKVHEEKNNMQPSENANICEVCGAILADEAALEAHMNNKHVKQFTCNYCGRMYKAESSFHSHVRKHEILMKKMKGKSNTQKQDKSEEVKNRDKSKRSICQTCGKDFVDERALLWHQRLHNDDRPYDCEWCDRSFVSAARRNQHALCAHSRPSRRCPLCPALFHLKSMVNTHLKKVHLKTHKRRSRTVAKPNVFWRTEPVPIQDLSVDVQTKLLEIRAEQPTSSSNSLYLDESQTL